MGLGIKFVLYLYSTLFMSSSKDINSIINSAWGEDHNSLSDKFHDKIIELNITPTAACELIGIETRTLAGILNASLKQPDLLSISKFCVFIGLDTKIGISLYLDQMNKVNGDPLSTVKRNKFLVETFDLPNLKKTGFISSVKDYDAIEVKIKTYFGFDSIYEYNKVNVTPAFSTTNKKKSSGQIEFWIASAYRQFIRIENPNPYDRDELLKIISSFRDYSIDLGDGLIKVSQELFKQGITVLFQPSMAALQTKGAVLPVKDKPCIIISDFNKSYASIWHSLIHELFHVLFDWDDIRENKYCRLSDDEDEDPREIEADSFAYDYLLPPLYERALHHNFNDVYFVEQIAKKEKIHSSIILFEFGNRHKKKETRYWILFNKLAPKIHEFGRRLNLNSWEDPISAVDNASNIKNQINIKN